MANVVVRRVCQRNQDSQKSERDADRIALVYHNEFSTKQYEPLWARCNIAAYPMIQGFVVERDDEIVGYIFWENDGGFRKDAELILKQPAILSAHQGGGIGKKLLLESLAMVETWLVDGGMRIKNIWIRTGSDSSTHEFYRKVLGAEILHLIPDLYGGQEMQMVVRYSEQNRQAADVETVQEEVAVRKSKPEPFYSLRF